VINVLKTANCWGIIQQSTTIPQLYVKAEFVALDIMMEMYENPEVAADAGRTCNRNRFRVARAGSGIHPAHAFALLVFRVLSVSVT
jgi:hypothetical protein